MANVKAKKGVIGILTGGGDVPGLNPAIRAVTLRALREGFQVIGIRHGWAGLVDMVREKDYDNSDNYFLLDEETVDRAGRTGGTFLHSSRTNPGRVGKSAVPAHFKDKYTAEKNDLTPEVLKNLSWLGIDTLIPIGGDNTLSYGVRLHKEGFRVIGIPKTMDNDVPGTDYCIGFSTCVTRTIQMVNSLRTSAGSHERRSEEHTSELQSRLHLVCRLLLEKKKNKNHADSRRRAKFLFVYSYLSRAAAEINYLTRFLPVTIPAQSPSFPLHQHAFITSNGLH